MVNSRELVRFASTVDDQHQRELIAFENPLAKEFFYTRFAPEDFNEELEHYLWMTSLPYVIGSDITFDLRQLWQPGCKRCLACSNRVMDRMFVGTGNLRPTLIVIGDAPSHSGGYGDIYQQGDLGRVWIDNYKRTCQYIRGALRMLGLHHFTWYSNLMKRSIQNNAPSNSVEIEACSLHLDDEIKLLKPDMALLLGNHADVMFNSQIPSTHVYHPAYMSRMNKSIEEYADHIEDQLKQRRMYRDSNGQWVVERPRKRAIIQ